MDQYGQQEPSKAEPQVQINALPHRKKPGKFFRPLIHRTLSISVLIVFALVLIALIEVSLRKFPQKNTSVRRVVDNQLHKRQDPDLDGLIKQLSTQVDALSAALDRPAPVNTFRFNSPSPVRPGAPPPSAFLNPAVNTIDVESRSTSRAPGAPAPGAFLNQDVSTFSVKNNPTPAPAPVVTTRSPSPPVQSPVIESTSFSEMTIVNSELPESFFHAGDVSTRTFSAYETFGSSSQESRSKIRTASSTSSTAQPTGLASLLKSDKPLSFVQKPSNYFHAVYFPVLLAVLFKMLIGYLYTVTKMVEPFVRLSREHGAKAKDFMFINYLAGNDSFAPLKALVSGHWLMLLTVMTYIAVQLLSALSSELYGIYPSYHLIDSNTAVNGGAVWVHPRIARALQGILAFVCIMLITVRLRLNSAQPHIYSDPSSIAGLASLIHHPSIAQDLTALPQSTKKKDILSHLSDKRYRLGSYTTYDGTERYGIITDNFNATAPYGQTPPYPLNHPSSSEDSPPSSRITFLQTLLLAFITLVLLALIIAYHFNHANNGFERFMDAQTFGPRFLLTIAGMVVKSGFSKLERRAVILEPLTSAYHSNGTPASTVSSTRPLVPAQTFVRCLVKGRFHPSLLAFTALLAEALIIILPGIPFENGQVYTASRLSREISIAFSAFMLLVLLVHGSMALVARTGKLRLPIQPDTVGAMMVYLAGSRLVEECADLSTCTGREVRREVDKEKGRRVRLVRVNGGMRDRWVLDYEERGGGV